MAVRSSAAIVWCRGLHQDEVAVQQLGEGDVGARLPLLPDPVHPDRLGVRERGRAIGDGLAQAPLAAGDGMGADMDPNPQRTAGVGD